MDEPAQRVRALGRFEVLFGDAGAVNRLPALCAAVTAEDAGQRRPPSRPMPEPC